MEKIRAYLQLTRAHTAPLETVPAILGALLATGGEINAFVLLWGFFGLLYHLAGYSMNSIVDWEKGYDRLDRNKAHHPLNRGTLSLSEAKLAGGGLFLILFASGVGLAWGNYYALSLLILGAFMGVMYNFAGKETSFKFIYISIAHTTVFVIPYVSMGGDVFNMPFRLAALYVFLWVLFQISVSGEIKDIQQLDEKNFLRDYLGVNIQKDQFPAPDNLDKDILYFTKPAYMYSSLLKLTNLVAGGYLGLLLVGSVSVYNARGFLWLVTFMILTIACVVYTVTLTRDGRYYRDWRISMMARVELMTLFIFIGSFFGVIGLEAVVTLMVGSVIWIVGLNLVEWGTWLAPDV